MGWTTQAEYEAELRASRLRLAKQLLELGEGFAVPGYLNEARRIVEEEGTR